MLETHLIENHKNVHTLTHTHAIRDARRVVLHCMKLRSTHCQMQHSQRNALRNKCCNLSRIFSKPKLSDKSIEDNPLNMRNVYCPRNHTSQRQYVLARQRF